MIQTYFDRLKRVIDGFAAAPFVLDAQVSFDLRPGDQGFVVGTVLFQDQSSLRFREYLDGAAGQVSKLMYSYHYQDANEHLVFRYDNARHRPPLPALEHKHTFDRVITSQAPALETVLGEIAVAKEWVSASSHAGN